MSRSIILTFGSLASFTALAIAQSTIEPPRRATPPADASVLAAPTKGAVVLPGAPAPATPAAAGAAPAPAAAAPAPATPNAEADAAAKPPVATGAPPAALEAAKARMAEARARAAAAGRPTGGPTGGAPTGVPGLTPGGGPGAGGNPAGIPGAGGPGAAANKPKTDGFTPAEPQFAGAATGKDQTFDVEENLTATVDDVINSYEIATGVTVLRTGNIQGVVPIKVNPSNKMSKEEMVDYYKAVLMVNGFSIHEYAPKFHAITFTGTASPFYGAVPSFGGNKVYTREVDLPNRDEFVNYFMKFDNLTAQDAATIIGQPQHQSGKVTPIASAGGLLITESVPVIKTFIAIKKEVDVPGSIMENKFVQLKIADAEEVAQMVQQLLQQQSQANSKGGSGAGGGSRLVSAPNAAQQLTNQLNPAQPNPAGGNVNPAGTQTAPDSASVVVQADRRTNRILISGKKTDVAYIEKMIHEFDLPSEIENFVTYPLRFIRVTDFLDLATGALEARGFGASSGGSGGGGGAAQTGGGASRQSSGNGFPTSAGGATGGSTNTRFSQGASSRSSGSGSSRSGGGSTGGGISGGGGGSSRGGAGGSAGTQALPTSVSVGKTLLISDPQSNAIIVSGTPEARDQIRILIQQMDKRPLQVHIDCVIAELTLGDDYDFGLDLFRKVDTLSLGGKNVNAGGLFKNIANGTGIIDPTSLTTLAAFPTSASGLNGYFQVGELVNAYVKAAESTNKLKIIQKPSISTSNNEPAYISIGQQVPYPGQQQSFLGNTGNNTGSVNSTVEYKDVVLSLDVTPLINSKEEVTLQIQQINDNVIGQTIINSNPIPRIGQQELNTKLTVPNHGIAVIGGLISDSRDLSNSGAPLLARIPIIRNLLGNTTKKDARRELMIFIQPSIMAGPDDMIEVNGKEIARTMVGPDAARFARPEVDMKDVVMPTAEGNIPYDRAGYPKEKESFWRRIFKRKTSVPADPAYPR